MTFFAVRRRARASLSLEAWGDCVALFDLRFYCALVGLFASIKHWVKVFSVANHSRKRGSRENILAMSYDGPEMEESARTANPSSSRIADLNVALWEKHAELLSAAFYDQNWRTRLNGQSPSMARWSEFFFPSHWQQSISLMCSPWFCLHAAVECFWALVACFFKTFIGSLEWNSCDDAWSISGDRFEQVYRMPAHDRNRWTINAKHRFMRREIWNLWYELTLFIRQKKGLVMGKLNWFF